MLSNKVKSSSKFPNFMVDLGITWAHKLQELTNLNSVYFCHDLRKMQNSSITSLNIIT